MYDQRNAPSGSNHQIPMNHPPLPPPPPTTATTTSQSYTHLPHMYPTVQHNYQPQNLYPNMQQQFPSPSASSSFHQPHLPPTSVFSHPPVTAPGLASYRPSDSTSKISIPFSCGNLGPPGVEKSEGENLVGESMRFSSRVLGQAGGSAVISAGSSKADLSLPLLNPIEAGSQKFADSDTEMEDDITHPDDDPGENYSTEAPKLYPNLVLEELDEKESLAEQPSSSSFPQVDTNPQTDPISEGSYADRFREEVFTPDSVKAQDISEFGGKDMYDPFVDSLETHSNSFKSFNHVQQHEPDRGPFVNGLKPHPNSSHVQQHEPASDPFVDRLKPHHSNLSHSQQHQPASDPFVGSLKPHANLSQVQQHQPVNDPFLDSLKPRPNSSHVLQHERVSDLFVHSLKPHPNSSHGQQHQPSSDPFVDSFKPHANLSNVQQHEPISDPFVDSVKHHPNSSHVQQHEPVRGSNVTSGLRDLSDKPRDVEESDRGSDVVTIVPGTSMYNKEFGESGNMGAEVDSIETGSSDLPDESADRNTNTNEVDSGRKSLREKRTNKDSRSMRLFKVVLTQFVKDCLKPSWRQGNMSKEAFKTIVKKTVDKVSNAMEGRRIPKSRDKIDRYIDSSQKKLTKLVMGYVDKYVKA